MTSREPNSLVPVEHRFFGLDRRLLWPTLGVFFVVLLWSTIMPAIDAIVASRVVEPGTEYDIGPARFTPTHGWSLAEPPSPVGESTAATVTKEGVSLRVSAGKFNGSAAELMERITSDRGTFDVEGPAVPMRTSRQVTGLLKRISGPDFIGMLIVFVDGKGHGIEVVVKGPPEASLEVAQPVAEMIKSIRFESAEDQP